MYFWEFDFGLNFYNYLGHSARYGTAIVMELASQWALSMDVANSREVDLKSCKLQNHQKEVLVSK